MVRNYRLLLLAGFVCLATALSEAPRALAQAPADTTPVIKSEVRLVIVDTVVTDRKGAYVHDLTQKDFRILEDGKEQTIKSFSSEAAATQSQAQRHYLVLFFDNSTIDFGMQTYARQAATKFIDANAGPTRVMAIANFTGALQITQNFTADADRLKKVVAGVKFSTTSPVPDTSTPGLPDMAASLSQASASFGVQNLFYALRTLAKNLAAVPGRKSLILFTAGFHLTPDATSELTALINVCNKSNVAVYPIDVRGLVVEGPPSSSLAPPGPASAYQSASLPPSASQSGALASIGRSLFHLASFVSSPFAAPAPLAPAAFAFQRGGGGPPGGGGGAPGGGGGSTGGGGRTSPGTGTGAGTGTGTGSGKGSGAGTGTGTGSGKGSGTGATTGSGGKGGGGTTTSNLNNPYLNNPYNQARSIVPPFPTSASDNQQFMYALAAGTGGFVIANTNDLLGGLEKIGRELNEFYFIGYSPAETPEGSCHTIQVKLVGLGGDSVRARSGYCNVKPIDVLAGDPTEKDLEAQATSSEPGAVHASMLAPYFYTAPNVARVDVAMEIPTESIKFEKEKGKFHALVNILGLVTKPGGAVAARFSDTLKLNFEKKIDVEEFKAKPLHYESQFDVASGQYALKVVFNTGGNNFGKLEAPLSIDPFDSKKFSLSGVALSKSFSPVQNLGAGLDAALIEDRKTLVAQGLQITPSGSNQFQKDDTALLYVEVYAPVLTTPNPPAIGVQLRIVDEKSGVEKLNTGLMSVAKMVTTGNPVVPVGMKLPVANLGPGAYRAELKAVDGVGRTTSLRATDFVVE
jgi:VWFA-related protein